MLGSIWSNAKTTLGNLWDRIKAAKDRAFQAYEDTKKEFPVIGEIAKNIQDSLKDVVKTGIIDPASLEAKERIKKRFQRNNPESAPV